MKALVLPFLGFFLVGCGGTKSPGGGADLTMAPQPDLTQSGQPDLLGVTADLTQAGAPDLTGTTADLLTPPAADLAACSQGLTACNGGCANFLTDAMNCGGCGKACAAGGGCQAGVCACPPGTLACNGACIGDQTDVLNCGGCGTTCPTGPGGSASCAGGACAFTCNAGLGNCDNVVANGCETNLAGDPNNCGACKNSCPTPPNTTATCTMGACGAACFGVYADCDKNAANGCEANLQNDPANCGACGNSCGSGGTCTAGVCSCNTLTYVFPPTPQNAAAIPSSGFTVGLSCQLDGNSIKNGVTNQTYQAVYNGFSHGAILGTLEPAMGSPTQLTWMSGEKPFAGESLELSIKPGLASPDGKTITKAFVTQGFAQTNGPGKGTFTMTQSVPGAPSYAEGYAPGLFLADYDGDGHLDLTTANALWLGKGDGTVTTPPKASWPVNFVVGGFGADIDADGGVDLLQIFAGGNGHDTADVLWGMGGQILPTSGTALARSDVDSWWIEAGDVDGNGTLDVILINNGYDEFNDTSIFDPHPHLLLQQTARNFTDVGAFPLSVRGLGKPRLIDLDNDGDLDLFLGAVVVPQVVQAQSSYYLNDGAGNFSNPVNVGSNDNARWVETGDVNGDGWADVLVVNGSGNELYFGSKSGLQQQNAAPATDNAVARFADVDSDGDLDLVGLVGGALTVFLNDGTGKFTAQKTTFGGSYSDLAIGDLDGDGSIDIAAGNGNTTDLWKNTCTGNACLCGNGVVDPGEACDPGTAGVPYNGQPTAQCNSDCTLSKCGDGKLDKAAGEQCDTGTPQNPALCSPTCQLPTCNDGFKDGAETDVDCGGGTCAPCSSLQGCGSDSDCSRAKLPLICDIGASNACVYYQDFETDDPKMTLGPVALPAEFASTSNPPWALDTKDFGYIGMDSPPCYPGHYIPNDPLWPIDGNVSAISGYTTMGGMSALQLQVDFPKAGSITFQEQTDWDVGDPAYLTFSYVLGGNKTALDRYSANVRYNVDGIVKSYSLPAGLLTLVWEVDQNGTPSSPDGCHDTGRAWIDDIKILGGAVMP